MTNATKLEYPPVDRALAQRLETAEVSATTAYVDARRSLYPATDATWAVLDEVHAVFDGASSPLTQTFGLGAFERPSEELLDELESFFSARGVATAHEVCSFADPSTWGTLSARGYSPIEASTVLVRPTSEPPSIESSHVSARRISPADGPIWCRVMTAGLTSESPELASAVQDLSPLMTQAEGSHCFLAELEGEPIAAGIVVIKNGVAVLGGASTIPTARRRGAQRALLQARLDYAHRVGVELAMVVAAPGSGSQRNAERQGFRPAYVRSKWLLPPPDAPSPSP